MSDGLLLDSHTYLWWVRGDKRLGVGARNVIEHADATVYLSVVTPWELQIKQTTRRLAPYDESFLDDAQEAGFEVLPVTARDGLIAGALPYHHRDPFDRMLVAQCMTHDLALMTADGALRRYDIPVFPATV